MSNKKVTVVLLMAVLLFVAYVLKTHADADEPTQANQLNQPNQNQGFDLGAFSMM